MGDENDKRNFILCMIIITVVFLLNIIFGFLSNFQIYDITKNDIESLPITQLKEAISILFFSGFASATVEAISWIIIRSETLKKIATFESVLFRNIVVVYWCVFHIYMIYNSIAPFVQTRDLMLNAGKSIFDIMFSI